MKILVSPFDQFEKHHFGSEDMCVIIYLYFVCLRVCYTQTFFHLHFYGVLMLIRAYDSGYSSIFHEVEALSS